MINHIIYIPIMTLHQKPFNEWMLKFNYSLNTYKISSIYFPIHHSIHSHQKVSENINILSIILNLSIGRACVWLDDLLMKMACSSTL
jgi:hypothetical protein